MGDPQNGWFIRENPIKMDDFRGTPISGNIHMGQNSRPSDLRGSSTTWSYHDPSSTKRRVFSNPVLLLPLKKIVSFRLLRRHRRQPYQMISNVYGSKLSAFHINSCLSKTERCPKPMFQQVKSSQTLPNTQICLTLVTLALANILEETVTWDGYTPKRTVTSATSTACANHRLIDVLGRQIWSLNGSRGLLPISWSNGFDQLM